MDGKVCKGQVFDHPASIDEGEKPLPCLRKIGKGLSVSIKGAGEAPVLRIAGAHEFPDGRDCLTGKVDVVCKTVVFA